MKDDKKIFGIDIDAERNLLAVVDGSYIDSYLTEKIANLMTLVDVNDQQKIVAVVDAYVRHGKRMKVGKKFIDHELRWILNRADVLKRTIAPQAPTRGDVLECIRLGENYQ